MAIVQHSTSTDTYRFINNKSKNPDTCTKQVHVPGNQFGVMMFYTHRVFSVMSVSYT